MLLNIIVFAAVFDFVIVRFSDDDIIVEDLVCLQGMSTPSITSSLQVDFVPPLAAASRSLKLDRPVTSENKSANSFNVPKKFATPSCSTKFS